MTQKLIIIHGLNNKLEALNPLGESFKDDYQVTYLRLPQHGQKPLNLDFNDAVELFEKELKSHLDESSFILSYSLGCAYLQYLWENKQLNFPMKRVIYLSPALKSKMRIGRFAFLPGLLPVPSFSPWDLRLRPFCYWGQYKTLMKLNEKLRLESYPLIYADPDDELISLEGLNYVPIKRDYLPYGQHHLTIHPRYFKNGEWEKFVSDLKVRFREGT